MNNQELFQETALGFLKDIQRMAKEAEDYVVSHPPSVAVIAGNISGVAVRVATLAGRLQGLK